MIELGSSKFTYRQWNLSFVAFVDWTSLRLEMGREHEARARAV